MASARCYSIKSAGSALLNASKSLLTFNGVHSSLMTCMIPFNYLLRFWSYPTIFWLISRCFNLDWFAWIIFLSLLSSALSLFCRASYACYSRRAIFARVFYLKVSKSISFLPPPRFCFWTMLTRRFFSATSEFSVSSVIEKATAPDIELA